jgi:hypothetical protein
MVASGGPTLASASTGSIHNELLVRWRCWPLPSGAPLARNELIWRIDAEEIHADRGRSATRFKKPLPGYGMHN